MVRLGEGLANKKSRYATPKGGERHVAANGGVGLCVLGYLRNRSGIVTSPSISSFF